MWPNLFVPCLDTKRSIACIHRRITINDPSAFDLSLAVHGLGLAVCGHDEVKYGFLALWGAASTSRHMALTLWSRTPTFWGLSLDLAELGSGRGGRRLVRAVPSFDLAAHGFDLGTHGPNLAARRPDLASFASKLQLGSGLAERGPDRPRGAFASTLQLAALT